MRFERFPDYWDVVKPFFETVEVRFLMSPRIAVARSVLEYGDADWGVLILNEIEELEPLAEDSEYGEIVQIPSNAIEWLFLNFADPNVETDGALAEPSTRHPLFTDKRVRQAISLAMPRQRIAEEAFGLAGEPTTHILMPPELFRGPSFPAEYDLDHARALLDGADFVGGTLIYQTSRNPARQITQEIVKESLEQIGFTIELKEVDAGVFFSRDSGNPRTYSHFYADLQMYSDGPGTPFPHKWFERFRSDRMAAKANNWREPNVIRYGNPDFDRLHDQAATEIDQARQAELWSQMISILVEDVVAIPLVRRVNLAAINKRIRDWSVSTWAENPAFSMKCWTAN